jgi:thymidylate synthase
MKDGFPLLTTKKMAWKTMVTELLWFLRGDTNIKYLVDNNCHIWDGDAYKNYQSTTENPLSIMEFIDTIKNDSLRARTLGELGPVYGRQWRGWNNLKWEATDKVDPSHPDRPMLKWKLEGVDQIANLINDLKTNPDSRRLMVNAWNVGELDKMVLPPCHYGFQVYTRELSEGERGLLLQPYGLDPLTKEGRDRLWKENNLPTRAISLMWNQRSVDTFLGLPFNIASYGLLLEIIAKEVNMVPDQLIGNLGDTHLYLNHIEQAKEQIDREPMELPELKIENLVKWEEGGCLPTYSVSDFTIENYQSHPSIKAPLSN